MPLIIVEGARRSGKSYLLYQQTEIPVFKFDFNSNFSLWNFPRRSETTHWFGLGKEIMLHELNLAGFVDNVVVDRGILTNSVWGVFQNRITEEQAKKDLINFHSRGLLKNTRIVVVEGEFEGERSKDIWDDDDARGKYERSLFTSFSSILKDLGVDIISFTNNFDLESIERFKKEITK